MERCKYYDNKRCLATKGAETCYCKGDKTECINKQSKLTPDDIPVLLYKKQLITSLKELVTDYVKIYVHNDTFTIDFYYAGEISYQYTVKDIYTKILTGEPTSQLAQNIVKTYKSILLSRHFCKTF